MPSINEWAELIMSMSVDVISGTLTEETYKANLKLALESMSSKETEAKGTEIKCFTCGHIQEPWEIIRNGQCLKCGNKING